MNQDIPPDVLPTAQDMGIESPDEAVAGFVKDLERLVALMEQLEKDIKEDTNG